MQVSDRVGSEIPAIAKQIDENIERLIQQREQQRNGR
jgi:hypothetical protein